MPTKRYRPEEIVSKLRQVDVLSRFAQLAPRMLSSPARFRRGMPNTPSVGWATQACLGSSTPIKIGLYPGGRRRSGIATVREP
jgi:hypothetical protein